jgi:lysophospholipase L1-like esterase
MLRSNDKILFIGDSITHAHRRPEEVHDCYSLGCGYVKLLAGRLNADRPELRLRFLNRGECGHRVDNLAQRWQRDCLELRPDVISILIGINDAHPSSPHATDSGVYARVYAELLEDARRALPDVRLVLLEPFGLAVPTPPAPAVAISAAQLRNLEALQPHVRDLAARFDATFVPLQDPFNRACRRAAAEHWALDGIHPSAAGHELIARAWLQAVQAD